jgi:hypothetical protein
VWFPLPGDHKKKKVDYGIIKYFERERERFP